MDLISEPVPAAASVRVDPKPDSVRATGLAWDCPNVSAEAPKTLRPTPPADPPPAVLGQNLGGSKKKKNIYIYIYIYIYFFGFK